VECGFVTMVVGPFTLYTDYFTFSGIGFSALSRVCGLTGLWAVVSGAFFFDEDSVFVVGIFFAFNF
jgi:hypothetical protein